MDAKELEIILVNHKHWLNKDCDGWETMRADLSGADLSYTDLTHADLRGANLHGADLHCADLHDADLRNANLSCADLHCADLHYADLRGVNLHGAILSGTDLRNANLSCADSTYAKLSSADLRYANLSDDNLSGADLYDADLRGVNLSHADLYGAILRDADLRYANLSGANLSGADLRNAKNVPFIPYACPDTGSFIGWKKASGKIICLEVPEDAKRSSATTNKCRCNKAKVLSITETDGSPCELTEVASDYDKSFIYKVGETVAVDDFDTNRWNECAPGIHFFIDRQSAVKHTSWVSRSSFVGI